MALFVRDMGKITSPGTFQVTFDADSGGRTHGLPLLGRVGVQLAREAWNS
jgi:hypothetical protein